VNQFETTKLILLSAALLLSACGPRSCSANQGMSASPVWPQATPAPNPLPTPNDPSFATSTNLQQVNVRQAWAVNTDCSNVVIAVIDNGVDSTHPDLASNIYNTGWDFWHNSSNTQPDAKSGYPWHGTFTTGIIGAVGNNGLGTAGICWKAKILVIKKHLADQYSDSSVADQIANAINYAVSFQKKEGQRQGHYVPMIINNSYPFVVGLNDWNKYPQTKSAIDAATAAGIGMFFAASNDSQSNDNSAAAAYPASYSSPNLI
jgi:subtilisin family serine protease